MRSGRFDYSRNKRFFVLYGGYVYAAEAVILAVIFQCNAERNVHAVHAHARAELNAVRYRNRIKRSDYRVEVKRFENAANRVARALVLAEKRGKLFHERGNIVLACLAANAERGNVDGIARVLDENILFKDCRFRHDVERVEVDVHVDGNVAQNEAAGIDVDERVKLDCELVGNDFSHGQDISEQFKVGSNEFDVARLASGSGEYELAERSPDFAEAVGGFAFGQRERNAELVVGKRQRELAVFFLDRERIEYGLNDFRSRGLFFGGICAFGRSEQRAELILKNGNVVEVEACFKVAELEIDGVALEADFKVVGVGAELSACVEAHGSEVEFGVESYGSRGNAFERSREADIPLVVDELVDERHEVVILALELGDFCRFHRQNRGGKQLAAVGFANGRGGGEECNGVAVGKLERGVHGDVAERNGNSHGGFAVLASERHRVEKRGRVEVSK